MSDKTDNLIKQLALFGLSEEEGSVYLSTLQSPSVTALSLSKDLKIARTKIYRILEKLIEKGFVIEEVKGYGTKFIAEVPEKLLQVISNKERELLLLKSSTPTLINHLNAIKPLLSEDTKILHYRGREGMKQVTWNSLKAKDGLRIYEISNMDAFLDQEFSEKVRLEFSKKKKFFIHQLTNIEEYDEYTNVFDLMKIWKLRNIPKKKLNIKIEVLIYNDVYCMYDYHSNDVFIVEIYNQKLADMQKQIFDIVWSVAKPMKFINNKGKARL